MIKLFLSAGGASAQQAIACDYYQKLLMGALCQDTVDVNASVNNNNREIHQGTLVPATNPVGLGPLSAAVVAIGSTPSGWAKTKTVYNFLDSTASVAITPLSWLQVSLGTSVITQRNHVGTATPSAPYQLGYCSVA